VGIVAGQLAGSGVMPESRPEPLDLPPQGRADAERFVSDHLGDVVCDEICGSESIRGGQQAADSALEAFDVAGYAARRNEVHPTTRRGASGLSPWIRHGLLPLPRVWNAAQGPARDVRKFRDELLWQEYARHWYARLGSRTSMGVRRELAGAADGDSGTNEWDRSLACVDLALSELETDGWLVNQTRMWLSSHWSVRMKQPWPPGEDHFFAHLLDGSRAANRLGWQWTTGVGSSKSYGFSRWQVEKRAPGLCDGCVHRNSCPIQDWPEDPQWLFVDKPAADASATMREGPRSVEQSGPPEYVWLTGESLSDDDPALRANPNLPAVFVFDLPLLKTLQLSSKRLVFLVETLAELAGRRDVEVYAGDPVSVMGAFPVAVTHAPVPGFVHRVGPMSAVEVHPWPWLVQPSGGSVASFSAWRRSVNEPVG